MIYNKRYLSDELDSMKNQVYEMIELLIEVKISLISIYESTLRYVMWLGAVHSF